MSKWTAGVAGVLLVAFVTSGCGSSPSPPGSEPNPATTAESPATTAGFRIMASEPVDGFPGDIAVADVALSGGAGWLLTPQPERTIWRVLPGAAPRQVVPSDALADLNTPAVSLVGLPGALVVLAQRCDEPSTGAECAKDSGIVQLRDTSGKVTATVTLWRDRVVQAGGTAPIYRGGMGDRFWLQGPDSLYEIDTSGRMLATVAWSSQATPCAAGNQLYRVALSGGLTDMGQGENGTGGRVLTPGEPAPSATARVEVLSGSTWSAVPESSITDVGSFPSIECDGGVVTLRDGMTLEAAWSPSGGWRRLAGGGTVAAGGVSEQTFPTYAGSGARYWLAEDYDLQRMNAMGGAPVATGLVLKPASDSAVPVALFVAEQDEAVFACAQAIEGLPGPSASPSSQVRCGFAPVKS